jgi:hypothetical protein
MPAIEKIGCLRTSLNPVGACARTRVWAGLGGCILHLVTCGLNAQILPSILTTGGSTALVTASETLSIDPLLSHPTLALDIGFTTDEAIQPGQFFDSFSVTLYDIATGLTAIFLTADASGVHWAPPTDGAILLDKESILRQEILPPASMPALERTFAYEVQAPIPPEFIGLNPLLRFDLFDNQNGEPSAGWYSSVAVVPEPEPLWVAILLIFPGLVRVFGHVSRGIRRFGSSSTVVSANPRHAR